jgi:hypothetical protein
MPCIPRPYWFSILFIGAYADTLLPSLDSSDPFAVRAVDVDVPGLVYADWIFPGQMLSDDEKLSNFRDWVGLSTSIRVHPAAGLWNFGDGRRFGIRATMDISGLQALCDIPVADMICGRSFDSDIMPEHLNANEVPFSWDPLVPAREDAPLSDLDASILGPAADTAIFKLMYELLRGDVSRWKPYIDMIPSLSEYEEYAVLLWSAESRREWMESGTALHISVYEQLKMSLALASNTQNYLCRKFGGIASPLMRRLLCDNSLLRWASVALATRAWGLAEHGTCFIPFADIFNHGSDRNSLFPVYGGAPNDRSKNDGVLTSGGIYTGRDYKIGDEMTQTYSVNFTQLTFFISNSFTPREGYFAIENLDFDAQYMVDLTAFNYSKDMRCWIEPPRLQYDVNDISSSTTCSLNSALLTCYRLRRSQDSRRTHSIMSDHRKRLQKASRLAAKQMNNVLDPFSAVYFSTDDKWKAPVPLRVRASDRAAIEDLLRDIRRHHSLLRTTGAADVELSEHGATRALRNIGTFRVHERRAIEYCMAAVSRHLERIDALIVGHADSNRRGMEDENDDDRAGFAGAGAGANNGGGIGVEAGSCDMDGLQDTCDEAPTPSKSKKMKTKSKKKKLRAKKAKSRKAKTEGLKKKPRIEASSSQSRSRQSEGRRRS